jgi:hypothetical protein
LWQRRRERLFPHFFFAGCAAPAGFDVAGRGNASASIAKTVSVAIAQIATRRDFTE